MQVFVCPRSKVAVATKQTKCTHILTLLEPGVYPFLHPSFNKKNWLRVAMHDEVDPNHPNAPKASQVAQLLSWANYLPKTAIILVHCEAGISRSTAAALAILVQDHGIEQIDYCVKKIYETQPNAFPNPVISKLADDYLGCEGKLSAAAEKIRADNEARLLIKRKIEQEHAADA